MQSEHEIQTLIRAALARKGHKCFRANVGKIKMQDGRWFDTGLPAGHPDLYGYRKNDNQVFYIEVKKATGKPSEKQLRFHGMLAADEVIHGIARTPEQATQIVEKGMIGFGYDENTTSKRSNRV